MLSRRIWMAVLASVWILAACSSAPAEVPQAPAATQAQVEPTALPTVAATAPSVTEAAMPAAVTEPAATAAPAVEAAASGTPAGMALPAGETVYKIVPGESSVSYEVGETFLDQNRFATAVGVTTEVNGEVALDPANPQAARVGEISVDISRLTSDSARRDNALRERFLLSSQFPTATFRPTAIDGLPAGYTEGQEIAFKVTGDLTVQETTLPVTFDVVARLEGGQLIGTATTMIKMSDFGVGPISLAMLRTEDDVKLTFNFVARP